MTEFHEDIPWIKKFTFEIPVPSLKDNTGDIDRLINAIMKSLGGEPVTCDFSVAKTLPPKLRAAEYKVEAVVSLESGEWRLLDIFPTSQDNPICGLAMDIGTSMVVICLLDLSTQEKIDETAFTNPQIEMGEDILTRIHFAAQERGLERLKNALIETLNKEIRNIAESHGLSPHNIYGITAAGNTTMSHLFLGLDPYWICREPYIPAFNKLGLIKASELSLEINPQAEVLIFPNVGSYFGGDLTAGILASGITRQEDVSILVDVGTNAEVVIGNSDWLVACAGAAGPAMEGGVASIGKRAGAGTIDRVRIDPESLELRFHTIENAPPIGICGSGFIDLIAQLFLTRMIDMQGKFVPSVCGDRLMEKENTPQFIVAYPEQTGTGQPLTVTQPDIDSLMRSKAAMYTILTTVADSVGISMSDINRFYIAGTFGSYIDPGSAITIGMIPDLPLEKYVPLGNTSLSGAVIALTSNRAKNEIQQIHNKVTYLELNVNQEFMNLFSAAKFIPHTDTSLFPSVKPTLSSNT